MFRLLAKQGVLHPTSIIPRVQEGSGELDQIDCELLRQNSTLRRIFPQVFFPLIHAYTSTSQSSLLQYLGLKEHAKKLWKQLELG